MDDVLPLKRSKINDYIVRICLIKHETMDTHEETLRQLLFHQSRSLQ